MILWRNPDFEVVEIVRLEIIYIFIESDLCFVKQIVHILKHCFSPCVWCVKVRTFERCAVRNAYHGAAFPPLLLRFLLRSGVLL